VILALVPAIACSGEDRVEVVKGAKGAKELVYRDNVLVEERSFDAGGAILEERSFGPDSLPIETRSYVREDGRLAKVEARDASGVIVGASAYHYDRNGRLLNVSAEGSMGEGAAGMVSAGGAPQGSWTEAGDTTVVLGYDESGRVVALQTMKGGKAVSVERRSYGEGGTLSSVATEDKASGSSSELSYDEKGRPVQRRELPAKGNEIRTQYGYDEAGRLIEERRRSGTQVTSIRSSYADDGSLSRVETRRNGELLLAVTYIENGRVEELYEGGELFVKASYIGGRKVKDEFYSDGVLTRSRDYQ
jgi:antitoxin component YwqK of YwqJK toxin-antitoxin module